MYLFLIREGMPFQDVPLFGRLLSVGDVIFAAVLAGLLMVGFRVVRFLFRLFFVRHIRIGSTPEDFVELRAHCRKMFPLENVSFQGRTFTRGMTVRITLSVDKTLEGELIGMNADRIVCVVSKEAVAADRLDYIKALELVPTEPEGLEEQESEDIN